MTSQQKLVFVGGQCIIVVLFLEAGLRIVRPARTVGISHLPCIYTTDARNGYRYKPNSQGWYHRYYEVDNTVMINSAGFHDVEHHSTDPGLRIVAVGDSFTAAIEVPIPDTWTQVLQQQIRKRMQRPIHVVNLGMDGTGTDIHKDVLEQYLQCGQADIVILAFYENDIADMRVKRFFRDTYAGYVMFYQDENQKRQIVEYLKNKQFSALARWLYGNSYSARVVMNRMGKARLLRKNVLTPRTVDLDVCEYSKNEWDNRVQQTFRDLARLSREHDFRLLVAPVPTKEDPHGSMSALLGNISQDTRKKMDIIDVAPIMHELSRSEDLQHRELFWTYDHHFNIEGNRIFGTALAEALWERGLISSGEASPGGEAEELHKEASPIKGDGTEGRL